MKKDKKGDIIFPDPMESQGVKETFVGPYSLPEKARCRQYTQGRWSYKLKEENKYAYWQEFYFDKARYYHVMDIDDGDLVDMLDYWDRVEARGDRQAMVNTKFDLKPLDSDGSWLDPIDQEVFEEWAHGEDSTADRKLPIKAEYAIIHSNINRLSPADQRIYQYMFSDNMSSAEIKQAFDLKRSALSEEKTRFLEKIRRVFIELGFEVPTLEEVRAQSERRRAKMKEVEDAIEQEGKRKREQKSISDERARTESTTKPRAFAAEEQEQQDRVNDLDEEQEPVVDEYGWTIIVPAHKVNGKEVGEEGCKEGD